MLYFSCCLLQQVVLPPQALWCQSPVNHPLPGPDEVSLMQPPMSAPTAALLRPYELVLEGGRRDIVTADILSRALHKPLSRAPGRSWLKQ